MSNKISGRGAREGKGLISRANAAAKKRPKAASKVTKKTSAGSNPVVPAPPRSKNPKNPINPVEPVVPVAPKSTKSTKAPPAPAEDWDGVKAGYYSTAARNARKAVKKAIPNKKKLRSDIQASIYKDKPTF